MLDAADGVLRRAQRRRDLARTALIAAAFLASLSLVAALSLIHPAAPLLGLAALLALWAPVVARLAAPPAPVVVPTDEELRHDE